MAFSKLLIRNFLSHKRSVLNFHSGVNVITGQTDSGKTAILLALDFGIANQPSGDSFRSYWGGITKVAMTKDGKVVARIKGKEDLYKIDKEVFKTFGRKVPPEVESFLNMSTDNTHHQHDGLFLLDKTPGAVAQHYNQVANLTEINTVMDSIQKDINGFKQTIKYNSKEIEKEKKQLEQYSNLDKIEKEIVKVEALESKNSKLEVEIGDLDGIIRTFPLLDADIAEVQEDIAGEAVIDECIELQAKLAKEKLSYFHLDNLINGLSLNLKERKALKEKSKGKAEVDMLLTLIREEKRLSEDMQAVSEITGKVTLNTLKIKNTKGELLLTETKYNKVLSKLNKCPTCGHKLK